MQKAEQAVPRGRECSTAQLYPVFARMMQRGWTGPAAVEWLVDNGAIRRNDGEKMYHALRHRWMREQRKGALRHE